MLDHTLLAAPVLVLYPLSQKEAFNQIRALVGLAESSQAYMLLKFEGQ